MARVKQTLLFPKDAWTKATIRNWLKTRKTAYKFDDIVLEGNYYRARQMDPARCVAGTYSTQTWKSKYDGRMRYRKVPKKILAVFCERKR